MADALDFRRRLDAVRDRIDLSDIIGNEVTLVRRGREHVGLCPFHSDEKVGSFSVNDDKALYKCFACGASGDHFDYLMARGKNPLTLVEALKLLEADAGIDFSDPVKRADYDRTREKRQRAALADSERRRRNAVGLWQHATPMRGTPAESYLRGRGIDFAVLGRFPGAIRYRHDCWNADLKREIPAMVTAVTALDGTHIATHRTFLECGPNGWVKAQVERPKMVLGDFAGGHIALIKGSVGRMPLRDVPEGTEPAISEGIENGLSVAMADPTMRIVVAISIDNLGALVLPDTVKSVTLIGDNDHEYRALRARVARAAGDADQAAKHENAAMQIGASFERQIAKHQTAGRDAFCMWPEPAFKDFNDQLRGMRMDGS